MTTERRAGPGWCGGNYRLYRERVRTLDRDTVLRFRDELGEHQGRVQTNVEGALGILCTWKRLEQGDAQTLDFIIGIFEGDGGPNQRSLTGMIGFCEQLLYDMGVRAG